MKTPARLWLSAGLVLLLGSSCLMVAIASPARPEPNAERAALVVDESFGTRASARLFQVWGTGSWRVRDGAYVLRRPAARPRATSPNRALSVLRTTVRRSAWRLETTVRSQRDEYSVLFAFRNPRNYSYVHVDRRASRSGVYVVRRGKATRLAAMTTGVRVRREHVLELRREGRELKVYVGSGHDRTFVAKADVPGSPYLRAGLGSWHSGVSFDDLRITARGAAPTAGVSPSTGPTSNPSPSAGPTAGPTSGPTAGPTAGPTPTATGTPTTPGPAGRGVDVATSAQLTAALADARPGDVITMADGTYTTKGLAAPLQIGDKHYVGTFVASAPGTAEAPIVLQGSRAAIIDGNPGGVGTGTQYGLYLAGVSYWRIVGITVTNVSKGVVLDRSNHSVLDGLTVHTTGQEAIHLRSFSSDNVVRDNVVSRTGQKNETYGEGIYVGSANSNWGTYSGGQPDASDRNLVVGNVISQTSAESMDIKEGTTGGIIRSNRIEGSGMTGSWADSWIDLKGNGWLVESNHGVNAVEDGFQVHQALAGWGLGNVFRHNVAEVNAGGYGFWVQSGATGNQISCTTNTVSAAASGFANIACTTP